MNCLWCVSVELSHSTFVLMLFVDSSKTYSKKIIPTVGWSAYQGYPVKLSISDLVRETNPFLIPSTITFYHSLSSSCPRHHNKQIALFELDDECEVYVSDTNNLRKRWNRKRLWEMCYMNILIANCRQVYSLYLLTWSRHSYLIWIH